MPKLCSKCGTSSQDNSKFCSNCGAPLLASAPPSVPAQTYAPSVVSQPVQMDIPPAGTPLCVTPRTHTKKVNALAWSPDSTRLASASDDNTVLVWDVHAMNSATVVASFRGHKKAVKTVTWSPDGTRV